ncbi:succinylglutamate desuccinylase/aspartoacylase domain-containing protein [Streptomyces alkaliterrae]|uniref:Ethanolamine utilization protein EutE n=1 Tax=Streptomyces alkaliterrae TaxID=2213162 RepID=A0A5P0YLE7_9ACTN|nr:succinylglutamate desuccinylase/aspartoacylase family protein [Streptomyces alkaliterrae]MBB1251799.1 succinylglutamate desuccinylase/aspartoacylase family protein [Streptomyces alkaliterrae]MBB1257811.1 succinylglutamate desuccinylase/aspartoacylase family protein [Streptomyces alkaliterrae]MQS01194.1 ethanolamine utilization protein EutE [Streptomyces alkaliterrae]
MSWTVGPLRAATGTCTRGGVPVDLGTTTVELPLTLVHGSEPGPLVVITAGMHGGEFVGVDAAVRLADMLDPDAVRGRVAICPVANPPAVYHGRLGVSPLDGVNINRVFPGDARGTPTERLAAWHTAHLLDDADAYLDLHSGGIDEDLTDFVGYRLTGDPRLDDRARRMAHHLGIRDVVLGRDAAGGNSHAAAARLGVPAVLVETGDRGRREPGTATRLVDDVVRLLAELGLLGEEFTPAGRPGPAPPQPVREWVWAGAVTAETAGLWYPTATAGDDVFAGRPIGRLVDPVDGRATPVTSPATGRVFYNSHALTVAPGAELAAVAAPHPDRP